MLSLEEVLDQTTMKGIYNSAHRSTVKRENTESQSILLTKGNCVQDCESSAHLEWLISAESKWCLSTCRQENHHVESEEKPNYKGDKESPTDSPALQTYATLASSQKSTNHYLITIFPPVTMWGNWTYSCKGVLVSNIDLSTCYLPLCTFQQKSSTSPLLYSQMFCRLGFSSFAFLWQTFSEMEDRKSVV